MLAAFALSCSSRTEALKRASTVAAFAFLCSSKTELQTATHSLQMNTRLSDGFEMRVSTWSWVFLQNEHLRISSSWRLRNISPVWRGGGGSQDPLKFTVGAAQSVRLWFQQRIERCRSSAPKDCLPSGCISARFKTSTAWVDPGVVPPFKTAPVFLADSVVEVSGRSPYPASK